MIAPYKEEGNRCAGMRCYCASGEIVGPDTVIPPALRVLTLEIDEAVEVHTGGIPSCKRSRLRQATETAAALRACRAALLGEGQITVMWHFPEILPTTRHSKLLVFNGGEKSGKETLILHAYFDTPISSSLVVPVTIGQHRNGRFGTRAIATVPQIAGGTGAISGFAFRIYRGVEAGGKRYNPISASCPDGDLSL